MFYFIDILDKIGLYKSADNLELKIIAHNNYQLNKKIKNPFSDLNMRLIMLNTELNKMKEQMYSTEGGDDKKEHKDNIFQQIPSNSTLNLQYLSNAPVDIDTYGDNNKTNITIP
jgi:hypothetical protein